MPVVVVDVIVANALTLRRAEALIYGIHFRLKVLGASPHRHLLHRHTHHDGIGLPHHLAHTLDVLAVIRPAHLAVANHKSLDSDLKGGTAYTHEATVDISAKVGSTYSVFVNTLTESATDEEDTSVMIEFKDKNGTVLYHYERTVKLCPNRIVTLKGNYFTGSGNSITLSDDDWDKVDQPLFPTE